MGSLGTPADLDRGARVMKRKALFFFPVAALFSVLFFLGGENWASTLIRVLVLIWCFLGGALMMGKVLHSYWRWCGRVTTGRPPVADRTHSSRRGVRGIALSLAALKESK